MIVWSGFNTRENDTESTASNKTVIGYLVSQSTPVSLGNSGKRFLLQVMGLDNVSSNIPTGSPSAQSLIDYFVLKKMEKIGHSKFNRSVASNNHPAGSYGFL